MLNRANACIVRGRIVFKEAIDGSVLSSFFLIKLNASTAEIFQSFPHTKRLSMRSHFKTIGHSQPAGPSSPLSSKLIDYAAL